MNQDMARPESSEDMLLTMPALDPQAIRSAEAAAPQEWNVGDVILDLYKVKMLNEELGIPYAQGGFGRVYRVHHTGWNIDIAVKTPLQGKFETDDDKNTFTHECETWITLGLHPNIVSCHYVRDLGGIPRIFAEYVEGGSLEDWIENRTLYRDGSDKALERVIESRSNLPGDWHTRMNRD